MKTLINWCQRQRNGQKNMVGMIDSLPLLFSAPPLFPSCSIFKRLFYFYFIYSKLYMREAKKNGTQIGIKKGTSLTTQKSIECKAIILKHSKDFGGSLEDSDVIKLCGCSSNSYYKYKRGLKN